MVGIALAPVTLLTTIARLLVNTEVDSGNGGCPHAIRATPNQVLASKPRNARNRARPIYTQYVCVAYSKHN